MADMRLKENKTLLETAKDRYSVMSEDDRHNRLDAIEDIRFVNIPGAQWDENMKTARGDRPCYEYNKVRIRCKRVINDMRDNRPSGKVRGVEGDDREVAEIYEGLIRNIWNVSHGDSATDYAAEYQVEGGMGAWRVDTEYADDGVFNQDICIRMIENPMALYADPSARDLLKRDARDWIYTTRISHEKYKAQYGDSNPVDFEADSYGGEDQEDEWTDEETVRIAEYWYQKPIKKELWLLETGEVVDSLSDEAPGIDQKLIKDRRDVKTHQIMQVIVSGDRILEGPNEWAGRKFPWIMVYGEYRVIDGRKYWWGLPRHAKDAQRNYNVSKTAIAETIAQAPKGKWWATSKQAGGHVEEWAVADRENMPYMLYEADPGAPGPPTRMGAADVPVALLQQAAVENEDLKDVMGLPDSSMGASGDEKSGRAIYARQQQGEIATFNYRDNMAKAVELTFEILIDLIPEIYDTDRELRILGTDGIEDYKRINQVVQDPDDPTKTIRVNDLAHGKYDVTVTSGPAFSTQRQEAAEMYMGLTQGMPEIMGVAGDLIFKAVDLPYSDDIADRLQTMLPPQIQQMLNQDKEIPPEVQQMMAQADAAMQQVQQYGQAVEAANAELQEDKALNEKTKAEIKTETANVRAAKSEFEAQIAEKMAELTKREADLTMKEAGLTVKGAEVKETALAAGAELDERETSALEQTQTVDTILAEFMKVADQAIGTIQQRVAGTEIAANRQPIGGATRREGGKLVADVQFDDGSTKSISAVRDAGGLKIVPTEVEPAPIESTEDQE